VRGRRVLLAAAPVLAGRTARVRVTLAGTRRMVVRLRPGAAVTLSASEAAAARTRIALDVSAFAVGGVEWRVPPVRTTVGRARVRSLN
jgi:hypothetical protein